VVSACFGPGDAIACAILVARRTYWFIKLVLPTPLSPRMMTWNPRQYCEPISCA
jgi:hypothetical protein